ncbi:MAG: hypothetical protein V2A71_09965 [Candidatus Eisenbacteria bacterium]
MRRNSCYLVMTLITTLAVALAAPSFLPVADSVALAGEPLGMKAGRRSPGRAEELPETGVVHRGIVVSRRFP